MIDTRKIRMDFPIFNKNPDLVYLDSSATSLKPRAVIEAMTGYYAEYSANIKRGIYTISERATEEYEKARATTAQFIGAEKEEIIFTRNASESLNLLMYAYGVNNVGRNDEVVVSVAEHHSNFVTWQQLCANTGAAFKVINLDESYHLLVDDRALEQIITKRTKIVALTHVSNVLGIINPVREIVKKIKSINPHTMVVIDGAQAVPHLSVNVRELGCDFYVFSGHKMMGPTGIGVLWGKRELLDEMSPFMFGGEMIREVAIDHSEFAELPDKFEAGTPAIAEAIGLGAAIEYLQKLDLKSVHQHELALVNNYKQQLYDLLGSSITFHGPTTPESGILAFTIAGVHPHDIASILNESNVAVRAGHHCAMPLHTALGLTGSTRISVYAYNTEEEIERTIEAFSKIKSTFC